jgi:hypothetical protein
VTVSVNETTGRADEIADEISVLEAIAHGNADKLSSLEAFLVIAGTLSDASVDQTDTRRTVAKQETAYR